ncbi:glycosyltransferase family 2 protein [Photobacterium ganghwense]|uniref:glycosyltransferase family 2 protein n=1 Tax=Photobacterium ganghwense TaxID=320778 RepID=UPI001C2DBB1C|nr:glycosyltransferase family 2 protein [Photobacterium ganghwense]MBV1838979.1 glycosyltransferase [Photobacterium ganghwense]
MISIITPTYNSEDFILETYESIKSQTFSNWEWLVTDDCSSDSTLKILKEIQSYDSRVKVFHNKINSGAAVSRNNSISMASGDFIAFVDSDDIWLSDKLELQLKYMNDNSLDFSFTAYSLVDSQNIELGQTVDSKQKQPLCYEDMLRKKATLGCSTVMIRRNAFSEISMPNIRTGQDYALWLKLLKTGAKAYPLNKSLTRYRILPNSISRNKFKKAKRQWEIYRTIERLGLIKSLECFSFYAWRAVFRK